MHQLIFLIVSLLGGAFAFPNQIDWSKVKPMESYAYLPANSSMPLDGPEGRIIGGKVAGRNQFPYQVGIILYTDQHSEWCGGSLISDSWVVTAAHCTANTNKADVYLGTWERTNKAEVGQQIVSVPKSNLITHEAYNPEPNFNDIALIKLPAPIKFNEYIQPIALPKKSSTYPTYAGKKAILSGWGVTSDDPNSSLPEKLLWTQATVMQNSACKARWDETTDTILSTHICIDTTGGYSTCYGDSGGPLVYNDGKTTVLIGASSFGISLGCEAGWPDVFTRISSFVDWIEAKSGVVNK